MLPKSTKEKRLAGLPLSGLCHDSGLCRPGCCECPCSPARLMSVPHGRWRIRLSDQAAIA